MAAGIARLAVKLALWLLEHPDVVKQVVQEVHDLKQSKQ